jgi:hypothetical protein
MDTRKVAMETIVKFQFFHDSEWVKPYETRYELNEVTKAWFLPTTEIARIPVRLMRQIRRFEGTAP